MPDTPVVTSPRTARDVPGYRLLFDEDVEGPTLDLSRWLPYH